MQALIIGANGFVGSALSARLLSLGHRVTGLVRPEHAPRDSQTGQDLRADLRVDFRTGELGDPSAIARAAEGAELVFCCAGDHHARSAPAALAWVHVAGFENVVNAARSAGARRVVLMSCADVTLTRGDRLHWKEEAQLGEPPFGAVARAKLLGEEIALHKTSSALTVTALRPGWLWGAGERRNLPVLCREGLAGGIRLLGSGNNLLSTTHVDLLVDALIAAIDAPKIGGLALHVADPETQTAAEFFGQLSQALALPAPRRSVYALEQAQAFVRAALQLDGLWPVDVARRGRHALLDCLRASTLLDLKPRVTFEEGMQSLATWARSVGGPSEVGKLVRAPLTAADAARFEQLANDQSGSQ